MVLPKKELMALAAMPIPPELTVEEEPFTDESLDSFVRVSGDDDPQTASANAQLHLDPAQLDRFEVVDRWEVTDLGSAQWCMSKVAGIDGELEALRVQATEWAQRIEAWFTRAAAPLQARRQFFDAHLGRYAIERRIEDEKHNKTLRLPSGEVSTRRDQARVAIGQKDEVVGWVRVHHPELLKYDVGVSDLRTVASIVEVPTSLRLTFVCGCVSTVEGEFAELPLVGSVLTCPACGEEQLLGKVEVATASLEVRDPAGLRVPGVLIESEELSYTVKPAKP